MISLVNIADYIALDRSSVSVLHRTVALETAETLKSNPAHSNQSYTSRY